MTNWYVFGASLGIPISKLDAIKKECSDVEEQKFKMFQFWLQNMLDASWKKVVRVLEQNNHFILAATLSGKYLHVCLNDDGPSKKQGKTRGVT